MRRRAGLDGRRMVDAGGWYAVTAARATPGESIAAVDVIDPLALGENLRRFQQMFEQAGIGIGQVDAETGRFLAVNEQMCAILGYDRRELLTKCFPEITHPDDRAADAAMLSRLDDTRSLTWEKRYLRRDGALQWCRITVSRLAGNAGGAATNVALLEDITEQKRAEDALHASEERYRSLVDNLVDVVFSADATGTLTFVSRAVASFGYRPDALRGTHLEDLVHPQDRDLLHGLLRDAATHPSGELRLLDAARSIRIVRASTRPHVVDAQHLGVTGVIVDLTARRETEDQLRAAQKMEAVGRLAGGIAHDFNNMLSVILSYAELANGDLRPEDPLHGDLSQIIAAAMRAEGLTRQLLAFSRRQLLKPEALDLNELLGGLAKMLGRMIGEDIALTIATGDGLSRTRADRGQVEQVVMNLVVNARDALPDGGDVTIATRDVTVDAARAGQLSVAPGRYVELAVSDTGFGMDAATRARVFEPFFTTKEVGKGTGLGLSMVYGIVRQSGGAVEVESAPGRGATFRVLLPRDDGRSTEAAPRALRAAATTGHEPILVVEDEPALRGVIRRVLAAAGYEVHAVGSASEALALCERDGKRLRLILTDVIMPGMSGGALAARLQPMCPSAKVIFMSGYTDETIARHGVLDAEFLRKPFDGRTLTQRVRAVLDRAPE